MTPSYKVRVKNVTKIRKIKTSSTYEDMPIYYTTDGIRLLYILATYCGHLQGGAFRRICYKERQNQSTDLKC